MTRVYYQIGSRKTNSYVEAKALSIELGTPYEVKYETVREASPLNETDLKRIKFFCKYLK